MILADSRPSDVTPWWPAPLAVVIWLVIVWMFGQLLVTPHIQIESPPPIEARIIELPEPARPPAPVPKPAPPQVQRPKLKVVPIKKPKPVKAEAPQPKPVEKPVEVAPPKVELPVTKPAMERPSPAPVPATTPHAPVNAERGARAIYQPVPKIPDELREEALRTVAVARFRINEDGTVTVELVTPTSDPRINQLILNTLRNWRFFPALKDGKPVPSVQEIKIHVDIG